MRSATDNTQDDPIEVFRGTAWECGLVVSLLENAEIEAYLHYGGKGTMAPWDSGGGLPINRIMVATSDLENARQVVSQFYESMKSPSSQGIDDNNLPPY